MNDPTKAQATRKRSARSCKLTSLGLLVILAAAAAPESASQPVRPGDSSCPDQGVRELPSQLKYGPMSTCGSGISISGPGVTIHDPKTQCPTFAVYEPPHNVATPKDGYFTTPAEKLPITIFYLRCSYRWFLFIPIGTTCELTGSKNGGSITNLRENLCAPRGRDGAESGGRGTTPGGK